ncbi:hypothetical protein KC345_g304 [Hortaea werneckii]|nr:hypothetical protein KC345_g304 [Hortaea werneckii]
MANEVNGSVRTFASCWFRLRLFEIKSGSEKSFSDNPLDAARGIRSEPTSPQMLRSTVGRTKKMEHLLQIYQLALKCSDPSLNEMRLRHRYRMVYREASQGQHYRCTVLSSLKSTGLVM